MIRWIGPLAWLLMLLPAAAVRAQEPATDRLRVFVDCNFYCDMDFLRTEIGWVDYMRDRADAQVHILGTASIPRTRSP